MKKAPLMANYVNVYSRHLNREDILRIFIALAVRFPLLTFKSKHDSGVEDWFALLDRNQDPETGVYAFIQTVAGPAKEILSEQVTDTSGYLLLEIPHGHGSDLEWWVEYELLAAIRQKDRYALFNDDGWYKQPPTSYDNLVHYIHSRKHPAHRLHMLGDYVLGPNPVYGKDYYPMLGIDSPEHLEGMIRRAAVSIAAEEAEQEEQEGSTLVAVLLALSIFGILAFTLWWKYASGI